VSLRTQALLCFAAAGLAVFGFPRGPTYKFVLGAIAMMIGISIWQRDKRERADRAARLGRVASVGVESDDEEDEDSSS
jgi:hypothetical protein